MFDKDGIIHNNKIEKCYWCCDAKDLAKCNFCKRKFCKFCIKTTNYDNNEMFQCFVCGCFESTKVVTGGKCYLKNIDLLQLLNRYENLCNNSTIMKNMSSVLEDIDSMNVDHFPDLLEIVRCNIYSMLDDIDKLSLMVEQAIEDDNIEGAEGVLLPLFKVLTKHHVFNRLGQPQKCMEFDNMVENIVEEIIEKEDVEAGVEEEEDLRKEETPLSVAGDEINTFIVTIIEEEGDEVLEEEKKERLVPSCVSPLKPKSGIQKEEKPKKSDDSSKDISMFENLIATTVYCPRRNPHLVAPAIVAEERSFVIAPAEEIEMATRVHPATALPTSTIKWSWEKRSCSVLIPRSIAPGSVQGTMLPLTAKRTLSSSDSSEEATTKKRGRPRKYFKNIAQPFTDAIKPEPCSQK